MDQIAAAEMTGFELHSLRPARLAISTGQSAWRRPEITQKEEPKLAGSLKVTLKPIAGISVEMAERSKALDLSSSVREHSWVRIPLSTLRFFYFFFQSIRSGRLAEQTGKPLLA